MTRFIRVNNLYDLNNLKQLFIDKSLQKRTVLIGDYYFNVSETVKSYMILVQDINKRTIANLIYSRDWFDENISESINNIVNNINKNSLISKSI